MSVKEGSSTFFKCRKCRQFLFDSSVVINAHGIQEEFLESSTSCCGTDSPPVWYIREDDNPGWITDLINEADWTRGRLFCPKCGARVGAFDFITGTKCKCGSFIHPAIQIAQTKVDCQFPSSQIRTIKQNHSVPQEMKLVETADGLPPSNTTEERVATGKPTKEASNVHADQVLELDAMPNEEKPNSVPCMMHDSLVESTNLTLSMEDAQQFLLPSQSGAVLYECHHSQIKQRYQEPYKPTITHEPSDLSTDDHLKETLTCPVCLDVFYVPTRCHPCGHLFCDPCLRRLARKNPNNTLCPLCRQIIQQCTPHRACGQQILKSFQKHHLFRKECEKDSEMQSYPLPWQPRYHFRWIARERNYDDDGEDNNEWRIFGWRVTFRQPTSASLASLLIWTPSVQLSTMTVLLVLGLILCITCFGVYACMKCVIWFFSLSPAASQCLASHVVLACLLTVLKLTFEQYVVVR